MEVTNELTGEKTKELKKITKKELDEMKPDIRIDTSQDNPWTKEAEQNWLDGVLEKQHITFEEYINASPDHGIIPKNKMLAIIEARKAQQLQQQNQMIMQNAIDTWRSQDANNEQEMQ